MKRAQDKIALYELIDESKGEVNETIENWLKEVEKNVTEKVDHYKWVQDELEAEVERLKEESKKLYGAANSIENIVTRLKDRLKFVMRSMATDELLGSTYRYKLSKSAPRLVVDESRLPSSYAIVKSYTETDKERIKEELNAGKTIPGAHFEEVFSLRSYVTKGSKK